MHIKLLIIITWGISLVSFSHIEAQNKSENSSYKVGVQSNATNIQIDNNKETTDHANQHQELERKTINLHKVNEKGEFMGPEQKISTSDNSLPTPQEEKPKELPNHAILKKPE